MTNANDLPEYEHLDAEVLKRYEKLEDAIRDRAMSLIDSEELDEVSESTHLLSTVLIGVAYTLLQESGYHPRKVMERYLNTVEAAEEGKLVFLEAGVPN